MRFVAVVLLSLLLTGCFFSARPLFNDIESVAPVADGAVFRLIEDDSSEGTMIFHRVGNGYDVMVAGDQTATFRIHFFAIDSTPEQDFVIEGFLPGNGSQMYQAFVWPDGQGYRLLWQASSIVGIGGAGALNRRCAQWTTQTCNFRDAANVMGLYQDFIYPQIVRGGVIPRETTRAVPMPAS